MRKAVGLGAIVLMLSMSVAEAATRQVTIPALPATQEKASSLLRGIGDPVLKAALAQPYLRGRIEALLGFGGCDWTVNANAARDANTQKLAAYLDDLEDEGLMAALTGDGMLGRLNVIFDQPNCIQPGSAPNTLQAIPVPPPVNQGGPYPYPYPSPYPYGTPGPYGYPGGAYDPRVYPGVPYGGYRVP